MSLYALWVCFHHVSPKCDTSSTLEDTPITISPLANDTPTQTLSIVHIGQPKSGTVNISGTTQLIYTPMLNFYGTDSFTYTVQSQGLFDTAWVTVTVTAVNDPPIANSNSYTTNQGILLSANLLLDDNDADGDAIAVHNYTNPTTGTLSLLPNGTFTYTPPVDFYGTITFTYQISDGTQITIPTGFLVENPYASFSSHNDSWTGVQKGDLDGDGDIDLLTSDAELPSSIWLNQGDGTFAESIQFGQSHLGGRLGDLDGDGNLDAIMANRDQNTVFFNPNDQQPVLSNIATVTITVIPNGVAPNVEIQIVNSNDAQLRWLDDVNCGYEVQSSHTPYFAGGTAVSGSIQTHTYPLTGILTNGVNQFYQVVGEGCSGVDAASSEVGVFQFGLIIGN